MHAHTQRRAQVCTDSQAHLLCWPGALPFIHISSAPIICPLQDSLACDNNLSQPLRKLQFSRKTAQSRPPSGLWSYTLYPASHWTYLLGECVCTPPAAHPMKTSLPTTNCSLLAPPPPSTPPPLPHPTLQAPPWQVHLILASLYRRLPRALLQLLTR